MTTAVGQSLREEEFTGKTDWGLWWKILRRARPHWRVIALMVFSVATLAAVDALLALVPGGVVNILDRGGTGRDLLWWAAVYTVLTMVFSACVAAFIYCGGKISTHVSHDIRRDAFAKLQELSLSYFDRRPSGWLIARLTSDCARLSRVLAWGTLEAVWGGCFIVAISAIMLVLNWKLALWVMVVLPPLGWVSMFFQRRILAASRRVRKCNSDITAAYNESIVGVRTTKTLVREEGNLEEFEHLTSDMRIASVRNALHTALYLPLATSIGSFAVGIALWIGGVRVIGAGMTLGDLVVFLSCAAQITFPIQHLARLLADIQAASAAGERIVELLDTEPEIKDSPEIAAAIARNHAAAPTEGHAADGLPDRIESVEFRNVSFAYKEGASVLEDFTLKVAPGQTIALVGPTGGGKSTIVSLLCRFYEPTSGEILIDGVDYRRRSLDWLQSSLGIVLQAPHLFSGTIRENIRYGRLEASDEEVETAARLVNAERFILAMDDGYQTQVGEGGGRLSVGQKQLISFARAILADPKIFVMDEATSSVDTETERVIQSGIAAILRGRISFVIAHRLSTIRSADRILVIEGGRIVEDGDHRSLLARRGRYHELYTTQFARRQQRQVLEGN